jgi:hypothetical protein
MYKQMVQSLQQGSVAEFICAGGTMTHYLGDACQPLHVSFLHHGRPGHPEEEDVHAVYETRMLDRFAADIIAGVNETLKSKKAKPEVKGGKEAALRVIKLMRSTVKALPPLKVIEAFNAIDGGKERTEHMFEVLGKKTSETIAAGSFCLAAIWESAWKEGKGNSLATAKLGPVDRSELKKLYNTTGFVESFRLQDPKFKAVL